MNDISIAIPHIPVSMCPRSIVATFRIKGIGRLMITNYQILPGSKYWKCRGELSPAAWQSAHEFVRALRTGQSVHMYHRTVVAWNGSTYTPGEPCIHVSMTDDELAKHNPRAAELRGLRPPPPLVLAKKVPFGDNVVFESYAPPTPELAETLLANIERRLSLDRMYLESSRLISERTAECVLAEPRLDLNDLVRGCGTHLPYLTISEFVF